MTKSTALGILLAIVLSATAAGQDVMGLGVKHIVVLAEDQKVRVLRYTPHQGDRTPMHSHPAYVVYVLKGGRIRYTMPDGATQVFELKAGQTLLRGPLTHADEALDDIEAILVELK